MSDKPNDSPAKHQRMTKRPAHLDPPEMPENPPVPEPRAADDDARLKHHPGNPTRYGDWEHKGIAVDF